MISLSLLVLQVLPWPQYSGAAPALFPYFTLAQLLLPYTFPHLLHLWAVFSNRLVPLLILSLSLGMANWVVHLVPGKQPVLDKRTPISSLNTSKFYF